MHPIETRIYQTQQIREFERLAKEKLNITGYMLMQRAGQAAFDFLIKRWPRVKTISVFCGGGNNGGDGYIVARLAHEHHLEVMVYQVGDQTHLSDDAKNALKACEAGGVSIIPFHPQHDIAQTELIVDAICGVGLTSPLRKETMTIIKKIQQVGAPILSIDIPTGINADTGTILGSAIYATATMTYMGLKLGLLTGSGIACTGELVLDHLQLSSDFLRQVEPVAKKIELSMFATYLKPRPRDWHKGLSGHVLVVGGDVGFSGAARMAAEAALRVGAGLVSVATCPQNAAMMNIECPEIMCHAISNPDELKPLMTKANVVVLGPGLGQSAWASALWKSVCDSDRPLVIDADGLNLLSQTKRHQENWVLTPHPGEAARLLRSTSKAIQADRLTAVRTIQKAYGGVCVLKGAGTLIVTPDSLPALCDKGNPGMASAGMGDILSGVIGGFIAQGIPMGDAAKLGVEVHALAGDLAAKEGERGTLAMDLMPYLRRLSNDQGESQ